MKNYFIQSIATLILFIVLALVTLFPKWLEDRKGDWWESDINRELEDWL